MLRRTLLATLPLLAAPAIAAIPPPRLHRDPRSGRDAADRAVRPGRNVSGERAGRGRDLRAGEVLPGRRHGVRQRPGAARLVRRLHRGAGAARGAGLLRHRAGRGGHGVHQLLHRQRRHGLCAGGRAAAGNRRAQLHLRRPRLHLRPRDAGVLPPQAVQQAARRAVLPRGLLGRPHAHPAAGAVRRVRAGGDGLLRLRPGTGGRARGPEAGLRHLADAALPRLQLDAPRRRGTQTFGRRLHQPRAGGAAGGGRGPRPILTPFARSRFIAARNADYDPVETVAKSTELLD